MTTFIITAARSLTNTRPRLTGNNREAPPTSTCCDSSRGDSRETGTGTGSTSGTARSSTCWFSCRCSSSWRRRRPLRLPGERWTKDTTSDTETERTTTSRTSSTSSNTSPERDRWPEESTQTQSRSAMRARRTSTTPLNSLWDTDKLVFTFDCHNLFKYKFCFCVSIIIDFNIIENRNKNYISLIVQQFIL